MSNDNLILFTGDEVSSLLEGLELELIDVVRSAYENHAQGHSSLPHSTFLHFPNDQNNRIIALPAYLGGDFTVGGLKWIASFPSNLNKGMDRASAVIILNSILTGLPLCIVEGSIISAKRTAASAALAVQFLHNDMHPTCLGLIGCGSINFEIARFLLAIYPDIPTLIIYDKDSVRAQHFKTRCFAIYPTINIDIANDVNNVLRSTSLISIATTALKPHIFDLSICSPPSTILHVSLRDIGPTAILACDNIVDDINHVCRAETSLHLTEQMVGHRNFIRCTLADITMGLSDKKSDLNSISIFSPFGLGILDLAVASLVYQRGLQKNLGTVINSFFPIPFHKNFVLPEDQNIR
jgi:2,3-diaminopropionate biosynthesis protein SbnB